MNYDVKGDRRPHSLITWGMFGRKHRQWWDDEYSDEDKLRVGLDILEIMKNIKGYNRQEKKEEV